MGPRDIKNTTQKQYKRRKKHFFSYKLIIVKLLSKVLHVREKTKDKKYFSEKKNEIRLFSY